MSCRGSWLDFGTTDELSKSRCSVMFSDRSFVDSLITATRSAFCKGTTDVLAKELFWREMRARAERQVTGV